MNIIEVKVYDINNGPGIRTSIWTAGCTHHCKGCWSSSTWNPNQGLPLEDGMMFIERILENPNTKGVSILGGDPLYETMEHKDSKDLITLLDLCKEHNKPVWLWTGYKYEDIPDDIKNKCEAIIDGPFINSLQDRRLKYRGSSNQRVFINGKLREDIDK